MQPNTEPSPADVSMVAAALGETPQAPPAAPAPQQPAPQQPAQQPAPQMQPDPVTPQPAPTQQQGDPFESLFTQPTEVAAPVAPPQSQPVEPVQPAPRPQQPQAPAEPQQPEPPASIPGQSAAGEQQYQSFDEYMKSVTEGIPTAPAQPDPSKINPDDPEAIKGFFDQLLGTAEKRFEANYERKQAIQRTEKTLWEGAFSKYGSLRNNKPLRDMVHSIRMGHFQRGEAITPTQAADKLLDTMKAQYQKGVADNSVVTTIENVQPQGGGTGQPVPTTLDKESALTAVQTGGEAALANILDQEIKAGRL